MKVFFCGVVLLLMGCKTDAPKVASIEHEPQELRKELDFPFDQVIHYYSAYSGGEVESLSYKSPIYRAYFDRPKCGVEDSLFLQDFEEYGYLKDSISTKYFELLYSSFSTIGDPVREISECVQVFRDVLVFKKSNQIIGLTKICFTCGGVHLDAPSGFPADYPEKASGKWSSLKSLLLKGRNLQR